MLKLSRPQRAVRHLLELVYGSRDPLPPPRQTCSAALALFSLDRKACPRQASAAQASNF